MIELWNDVNDFILFLSEGERMEEQIKCIKSSPMPDLLNSKSQHIVLGNLRYNVINLSDADLKF